MRRSNPSLRLLTLAALLFAAAVWITPVARSFSPVAYLPVAHRGEDDQPSTPTLPAPTPTPAASETPTPAASTAPSETPTPAATPSDPPPTAEPPATSTPDGGLAPAVPMVVMRGPVEAEDWTVDPYQIQAATIYGDRLSITATHGGGCRTHDFHLVGSRLFMESNPVQSALLLTHDGHGDLCRAFVRSELVFDLSPLKRTYQHAYANAPGPIILRLSGWSETLRYDF